MMILIYKALEKNVLCFPHEWLPKNHGRSFAPSNVTESIYTGSNSNASGIVSNNGRVKK